jgi:hypothetical protein
VSPARSRLSSGASYSKLQEGPKPGDVFDIIINSTYDGGVVPKYYAAITYGPLNEKKSFRKTEPESSVEEALWALPLALSQRVREKDEEIEKDLE